jgi:rare lipoprotein A
MNRLRFLLLLPPFMLAACGGQPPKPAAVPPAPTSGKGGGYYLDDGPLDAVPVDIAALPDAVPRPEPLHRFANRPYTVLGKEYVPMRELAPFRQSGIASWYGRRYHGQKTSSGEPYDMFAMTAAHPTLPIPSYARVTHPDSGRSVVVRINDRGPFLHGRVIDLSYAAAWKLGFLAKGSGAVVVESVLPGATPAPAPLPTAAEPDTPRVLADVEENGSEGGHYLQLGAFASVGNAEALRARLTRTLGELGERLTIRSTGSLHRVQLGPWADAGEARRVAERLRAAFDLPSVLVR